MSNNEGKEEKNLPQTKLKSRENFVPKLLNKMTNFSEHKKNIHPKSASSKKIEKKAGTDDASW